MRITNLISEQHTVYTSNAFLILGDWSAINDVNTLIDTGSDPDILERIAHAPTGVGKQPVEQVILTHSHSDHTALLSAIRERYQPVVYAYSPFAGADRIVKDGQIIRCGDRDFEVVHTPGHSNDSICLYCQIDGVLFVGDTNVIIRTVDDTYEDAYVSALERLSRLDVHTIYFGHDKPLTGGAQRVLEESLKNVRIACGKRKNGGNPDAPARPDTRET